MKHQWFRRARSQIPPPAQGRSPPEQWDLDRPLLYLSPQDAWVIRHACEGVAITGQIGSGKTSGSGAAIAKAFLRAGFGGMITCAKPQERALWEQYAAECGRSDHLVIMGSEHPYRFNFLQWEQLREGAGAGLTENLVNLISTVVELVEGKVEVSGDGAFWNRAMREMLRNVIDVLMLSGDQLTLDNISRLIAEAPASLAEVTSESWQENSYCMACLRQAEANATTIRQQHDLEIALRYWLRSFPALSDRTRTGIVATFTSVADLLLHGIVWEILSTDISIVPEVCYRDGAIIVLDFPIQEWREAGRVIQGIFKYCWQTAMLRRDTNIWPRPVFLWADEAQEFLSSYDFRYQAVARSARACTVYLTQSVSNFYAVLGRNGRDQTHSFLGNMVTKIIHAQSDSATNQYFSDLISQEITTSYGFSGSHNEQGGSRGSSGSETVRAKLLPGAFATLKGGGPANGLMVDAIIYQGGRVFHGSGDTYLRTSFKQS